MVIDLTQENDTRAYNEADLIQQEAKEKFLRRIDELLDLIDLENDKDNKDISHNSILINGKRGYGKTTFMLSIQQYLCKKYNTLYVFDSIDPTIMEEKENIFLLILSEMNKQVESCAKNNKHTDEKYKSINNSFKEVASGLHVLNGIGDESPLSHNSWHEPEQILNEGIKKISGGHKLESAFRKYTNKVLKYLGKKAFVVIFDDIDTATHQGKTILELIRKYFTSPRIIVVLLGDVDLYNLIVREMQWDKLNPESTFKYEKEHITQLYESDIDTLVNQYMLKILKTENRINLLTLQNIKDITIKSLGNNREPIKYKIDEYIDMIIIEYFRELSEKYHFRNYIKSQPIRVIMSIIKNASCCEIGKDPNIFLTSLVHILKNKLSNIYTYAELDRLLSSFTYIQANRFNLLYSYIKKINQKSSSPDIALDFIPNTDKLDQNSLSVLMSCHIVNGVNNIKDICDYFIQVYAPISFKCDYEFSSNSFNIARLLNKDLRRGINNKVYKGTIHIPQKEIKSIKLNGKQRAIFNVLIGGLFTEDGLRHYVSIWNIFGFIAGAFNNETLNLQKLLQVKYFHLDDEDESVIHDNNTFLQEEEYDTKDLKRISTLSDKISTSPDKNTVEISNRQLNAIFTRIEYAIKDIDDNPSDKLGEQFHRYIIAILNSFIIVILESEEGMKFNNAISFSDGENPIFKHNLKKLIDEHNMENNNKKYEWLFNFIKEPFFQLFLYNSSKIRDEKGEIKDSHLNVINYMIDISTTESLIMTEDKPDGIINNIYKSHYMLDCLNDISIARKGLKLTNEEKKLLQKNLLDKNRKSYLILYKNPNFISLKDCEIIYEEYRYTRKKIPNKKEVVELFKKFIDDNNR